MNTIVERELRQTVDLMGGGVDHRAILKIIRDSREFSHHLYPASGRSEGQRSVGRHIKHAIGVAYLCVGGFFEADEIPADLRRLRHPTVEAGNLICEPDVVHSQIADHLFHLAEIIGLGGRGGLALSEAIESFVGSHLGGDRRGEYGNYGNDASDGCKLK